jgi:hypothetical protein
MSDAQRNRKYFIAFCAITILAFTAVAVAIVYNRTATLNVTGTLYAVGIDVTPANISWGMISPGQTIISPIITLTNTGNKPVTLTFNCSAFNPTIAEQYFTVTWTYLGQTIQPNTAFTLTFSLKVAYNTTGFMDFSYITTVYAI